ncbi:hypothetical protein ABCS02_08880 [Microbacterium sp. X-17]|uniref:hypothetical protein n=1 Tax=Microbacterium sp. X-17 TaxID=3144404 RepID=UPI0031F5CEA5
MALRGRGSQRQRFAALATSITVATAGLVAVPVGAIADDGHVSVAEIQASLTNTERVNDALIAEATPSRTTTTAAAVAEVGGGTTVSVPIDPAEGISLTQPNGSILRVELPNAQRADDAARLPGGGVAYTADGDSANTVIPTSRGVQMLTTVAGGGAPTRYGYEVSLGEGQRLELLDEGGALVVNTDGSAAAAVSAPWAKDANGRDVPTHYELAGNALVQVIDHASVSDVAYPVVADPIWLAPWVVRCLIGIGLNGAAIARIASTGSPGAILAAGGFAALRCVLGR